MSRLLNNFDPTPNYNLSTELSTFHHALERLRDYFEKIFRGCFGFTQPGSHIGRAVARKEAELALHTTYSIANYIVKKIVKA